VGNCATTLLIINQHGSTEFGISYIVYQALLYVTVLQLGVHPEDKKVTCLIIVVVLQLTVLQLGVHPEDKKGTSLKDLLKDPYILIAAG